MKRRSKRGRCPKLGCRSPKARGRSTCWKHYERRRRATDPVRARFRIIKDRAAKKKRDFTLSLRWFRDFCKKAGFPNGERMHFDREDATEGYHDWNVRFITATDNIIKGNIERHCPRYRAYLERQRAEAEALEGNPF